MELCILNIRPGLVQIDNKARLEQGCVSRSSKWPTGWTKTAFFLWGRLWWSWTIRVHQRWERAVSNSTSHGHPWEGFLSPRHWNTKSPMFCTKMDFVLELTDAYQRTLTFLYNSVLELFYAGANTCKDLFGTKEFIASIRHVVTVNKALIVDIQTL